METLQTDLKNLKLFIGSRPYVQIATRGEATLGLFVSAPSVEDDTTVIFLAFAVIGAKPKDIKHFTVRDSSTYRTEEGRVTGFRLNKVVIPCFDKPVPPAYFGELADKAGILAEIGKWITAQIAAEGFTPLVFDLTDFLKSVYVPLSKPENVNSILSLPDFEDPSTTEVQISKVDENDFNVDDEDEDHDEDEDDE